MVGGEEAGPHGDLVRCREEGSSGGDGNGRRGGRSGFAVEGFGEKATGCSEQRDGVN